MEINIVCCEPRESLVPHLVKRANQEAKSGKRVLFLSLDTKPQGLHENVSLIEEAALSPRMIAKRMKNEHYDVIMIDSFDLLMSDDYCHMMELRDYHTMYQKIDHLAKSFNVTFYVGRMLGRVWRDTRKKKRSLNDLYPHEQNAASVLWVHDGVVAILKA